MKKTVPLFDLDYCRIAPFTTSRYVWDAFFEEGFYFYRSMNNEVYLRVSHAPARPRHIEFFNLTQLLQQVAPDQLSCLNNIPWSKTNELVLLKELPSELLPLLESECYSRAPLKTGKLCGYACYLLLGRPEDNEFEELSTAVYRNEEGEWWIYNYYIPGATDHFVLTEEFIAEEATVKSFLLACETQLGERGMGKIRVFFPLDLISYIACWSTRGKRPNPDYICPITLQLIQDPVEAGRGKYYERIAVEEVCRRAEQEKQTQFMLPLPGGSFQLLDLGDYSPDWKVKEAIAFYRKRAASFGKEPSRFGETKNLSHVHFRRPEDFSLFWRECCYCWQSPLGWGEALSWWVGDTCQPYSDLSPIEFDLLQGMCGAAHILAGLGRCILAILGLLTLGEVVAACRTPLKKKDDDYSSLSAFAVSACWLVEGMSEILWGCLQIVVMWPLSVLRCVLWRMWLTPSSNTLAEEEKVPISELLEEQFIKQRLLAAEEVNSDFEYEEKATWYRLSQ